MRTISLIGVTGALLAFMTGCGSDATTSNEKPAPAGSGGQFETLMDYEWTVDPGVEAYYCGYRTLTEDLYISDFRPIVPEGTHHVVLGYQNPAHDEGYFPAVEGVPPTADVCTGVTFGDVFAFAATVGTEELSMPEGVAVKIPAGQQLVLGLHMLNATAAPVTARSGVAVVRPEISAVTQEAEVISAQAMGFTVPPGESTVTATCTMTGDSNIFAVMPHMHKTGTHMTTTAGPSGVGTTLLDQDYQFTDQKYATLNAPLALKQGEQVHVQCNYVNPGSETLLAGESTINNEMCLTFLYRYPALAIYDPVNTSAGFEMPRGWCVN
jgi:hypothetical protein